MLHIVITGVVIVDPLFSGLSLVGVEGDAEFVFEVAAVLDFACAFSRGEDRGGRRLGRGRGRTGDLGEDVGGGCGIVDEGVVLGSVDEGVGRGCFLGTGGMLETVYMGGEDK